MFMRNRTCYCMNNNHQNNIEDLENNTIEMDFYNSYNNNDYTNDSKCGFDEEKNVFPENPMLAQSYVPYQYMDKTFKPNIGLKMGTIFPELVSPYTPCQDMREIEYIAATNRIKEECDKCQ